MVKIKFTKSNREVDVQSGSELLEIYRKRPDLPLKFGCTRGDCGTCAILIKEGMENLTKQSESERITLRKKGCGPDYRLACQCAVNGFLIVES